METTPAAPAVDEQVRYEVGVRQWAECRIRLFHADPLTVVIATDLDDDNPGPSVTNSIEAVARHVLARYPVLRERMVLVEHYDDRPRAARAASAARRREILEGSGRVGGESFDLVRLPEWGGDWPDRPMFFKGQPIWKRVTKAEVEQLIGARLP